MNPRWSIVAALSVLAVTRGADAQTLPGAQTYQDNCQSCHGTTLAGGRGPSLFSESLLASHSDETLRQIVKTGIPNSEMPSAISPGCLGRSKCVNRRQLATFKIGRASCRERV